MKTEYKRDLQNNYLILEAPQTGEEEGYSLRMAEQNRVKGLLPVHETRRDGKLYLHYEITSKQTLETLFEKKVMGYQDILTILSGLRDTLEDMRRYLLSPQQLLFAPELIYVLPEHGGLLFCYYIGENQYPITILAEFILKRLDHRDRQAIALGYGFFQKASSENFSLAKTLEEILAVTVQTGEKAVPRSQTGGRSGQYHENVSGWDSDFEKQSGKNFAGDLGYDDGNCGMYRDDVQRQYKEDGYERYQNEEYKDEYGYEDLEDEDDYRAASKERKRKNRKSRNNRGLTERLFSRIHPAVLLTFLSLVILLEVLIVYGVLSLTEAGGCFFLILAVETLVNHRILHKIVSRSEEWTEEEENEEYQSLLREAYQDREEQAQEPAEETLFMFPETDDGELCLVLVPDMAGAGKTDYPEICPDTNLLYVGKLKGEADVILNAPTVSRLHARLEIREGKCYLKDMNSKNGTFTNGRRLMPQEECEVKEDDTIAFSEIRYRVVKRRGHR